MSFAMTFSCMYVMYFDHIHTHIHIHACLAAILSPFLFLCSPFSPQLVSPFNCMSCFLNDLITFIGFLIGTGKIVCN